MSLVPGAGWRHKWPSHLHQDSLSDSADESQPLQWQEGDEEAEDEPAADVQGVAGIPHSARAEGWNIIALADL